MATDEVGKLKAELHSVNCRIQAERNDEIRHALNRTRLENERAQTLVKLMDALAAFAALPVVAPELPPPPPMPVCAEVQAVRRKLKPDGLPPMSVMIVTALQASGKAQRPVDIANYVRQRWWPTLATPAVNSQVWHMAKVGKLICRDGYYGLNGPNGVGHYTA